MKKLALLMSVIILVLGGINIKMNMDKNHRQVEKENTQTLNRFVASMDMIESRAKELVDLASEEEAVKLYLDGNFSREEIVETLSLYEEDGSVDFIYYANIQDEIISVPHFDPPSDYKPTTRGWYKMAMASLDVIITDIYIDAFTGDKIMTLAKALNDESVLGLDYNLKALDDTILTLENVQIFNSDGSRVIEEFTSVPMDVEVDDFDQGIFETEHYKYYKASAKISDKVLVYGVDKISQEKLLTSSTVQRTIVFLLLSSFVYLVLSKIAKT
ncbi:hypothetical protein EZV73_09500 [Acidaminobacter sp. JC074]|uniref:PDC sensor domain-containing protein n=1 Tax=Acidaminobacter sp. JC074 TaxID=2530199 RepID=UPI001F0E96A3|nr:PDC sensor domain-containing protein [Acidaminobacter sp. JC074]MCH4887808.1 hypothetical protein [Acidaminobacter sp. JC074]